RRGPEGDALAAGHGRAARAGGRPRRGARARHRRHRHRGPRIAGGAAERGRRQGHRGGDPGPAPARAGAGGLAEPEGTAADLPLLRARDRARPPHGRRVPAGAPRTYGTPPWRMRPSVARSMFPPETTHTTFPPPARPATTRLRSARVRIAEATASSGTTTDPSRRRRARGHISARTPFPPMPS